MLLPRVVSRSNSMTRRGFLRLCRLGSLFVAVALLCSAGATAQRVGRPLAEHVILISVDGFGADCQDDPRLPIPNIRRLAAEGARADRMTVSTPSVTWPNHTTLVTGVPPARHGVLANGVIEPRSSGAPMGINSRRSKLEMCRVPTIYDVAKQAGLRTAEINWPVTRDAPTLDLSLPDYPDALQYTTPSLLQELRERKILGEGNNALSSVSSSQRDHIWGQAAVHVLRRHRPNLLLLHLLNTDGTQHQHGPGAEESYTALALADRVVGDVVEAVRDAGLRDRTAIFVVADHGFVRVERMIQPNVRLRANGLIREQTAGELSYDAQSISEGGLALVYVPDRLLKPELVARTREALEGLEGVDKIVEPKDYAEYGLPALNRSPQAPDFVLSAKDGYAFGNSTSGEEIVPVPRPIGAHGYLHTNPKMDALCVAAGAGIRRGTRVERVQNLDIAPTLARLLGLDMGPVDGRVLTEFIAE